jgi:serine/threonine-protein kinase
MDDISSRPLQGTEGVACQFFSPDGRWIGFSDETEKGLKKIAIAGGTATYLCKTEGFLSGSWCTDNAIVFSNGPGELWRFTASEGTKNLTIPDPNQRGAPLGHMCPQSLPDGEHVLFTNRLRKDRSRMELLSLRTGRRRILHEEDGTDVRYVPTGHLVFARDDTLFAVPFDIDKLEIKGPARPVVEDIHISLMGPAQYTFSENGTLAYISALPRKRKLVWVDRQGVVQPLGAPSRAYQSVRVSPDGTHLAVTIAPKLEDNADIWILDKARLTPRQITFDGCSRAGIWTPDSKRVIYTNIPGWKWSRLLVAPMSILADGSGEPETLAEAKQFAEKLGLHFWGCRCLSPDGKYLLGGTNNIWVLPMEPNARPKPFIIRDNSFQRHPAFSPDGKWIAYDSGETGRQEIYVCPFPKPGGITRISSESGAEPIWSRDGSELFYRSGDKMMVVTIEVITTETGSELKAGTPRELFKGQFFSAGVESVAGLSYDLDTDGRFIMIQEDEESPTTEIHVVLNWFEELKRLVPTDED